MHRFLILIAAVLFAATPAYAQTVSVPPTVSIVEGQPWSVPVTRIGPKSTTLSFTFCTVPDSALVGADFVARCGSQSIRKNAMTYTINGQSIDNSVFGSDKRFFLDVTAKGHAPVRTAVVLRDNDPVPAVRWCKGGVTVPYDQQCPVEPAPIQLQTCTDGAQIPITEVCPSETPPPLPGTKLCDNGQNIPATETCPAPVPPPPTPPLIPLPDTGYEKAPSLQGSADVPFNFDHALATQPAWGVGKIPGTAVPDVVGAFRILCSPGEIRTIDPIIYKGQHHAGHPHEFTGAVNYDENSTADSLRKTNGGSRCNLVVEKDGTLIPIALNGSLYWVSALKCGAALAMYCRPDHWTLYYKRRPPNDPKCVHPSNTAVKAEGICISLPNGLKQVAGNLPNGQSGPLNIRTDGGRQAYWSCSGTGAGTGHYANLKEARALSPLCPTLHQNIQFPGCWNGKDLDSPNHMDHMAYGSYGSWGYYRCPTSHPYVIPGLSEKVAYDISEADWATVGPDGCPQIRLAADNPGDVCGSRIHADYIPGWDGPTIRQVGVGWESCLSGLLNASGGDLCTGLQLKGASSPRYKDPATGKYLLSKPPGWPYEPIPEGETH